MDAHLFVIALHLGDEQVAAEKIVHREGGDRTMATRPIRWTPKGKVIFRAGVFGERVCERTLYCRERY